MFTLLDNRAIFELTGPDAKPFLQGLITNDIYKLPHEAIYAFLLTAQGKYLYDFFIIERDDKILLEYESKHQKEIVQQLKKYKIGIQISLKATKHKVYSSFTAQNNNISFDDPRTKNMGVRIFSMEDLPTEDNMLQYELQRIKNVIPDGEKDLITGRSFPFESNIDYAIDFNKGCYIGQEVVARTTSRGVIRKKLFMIEGDQELKNVGNEIVDNNKNKVGDMRSTCQNIGLALLRVEEAQKSIKKTGNLFINEVKIKVHGLL